MSSVNGREERRAEVPQVEGSVVSSESVRIKPFNPQTFDSLQDALMAGNEFDDYDYDSDDNNNKKQVEFKAPQWERLTREEVYGKKE